MRRRLILALALAALSAARLARAEEGPVIISHNESHPYLTLDPFHGSVELTGIYEMDHSSSNGSHTSASDGLLTQQLTLGTGGNIVSPQLFKWSATGSIQAQEEWSDLGSQHGTSIGYFDAYDVNLAILNGTQYPVNVFADRSQAYINRAFAGLLRNTVTDYGASVQYRSPTLPTTLNYIHTNTVQTDLANNVQYNIDQSTLDLGTSFQPWERHNVTFNYSYGTVSQNNPGALSNSSQRQSVAVSHDWSIDPLGRYTLSQNFNYSQQTGTYSETRLRLGEQLRAKLADNLDGALDYTLEQQKYQTSSLTTQLLSANITHRLFESLTTTGRAGMSLSDNSYSGAPSSSAQNYFASLGTNYTKKVFLGRFGANLSLGISENTTGAIGAVQQVLGDVQTFTDPQPIILTRTGVNPGSIAVFDASGTRRFVQGIDYTVHKVGNTVQIDRIIGGNINTNDTVRLNYNIDPLPGYSAQALTFGTGANYSFEEGWLKGLNLYMRYYQVDQSISPASSGIAPDNIRDTVLGAEYRVWKLTLRAEDEMHESTLAPYDSLRLTATYADSVGDRGNISLTAAQSFIHMPQDQSSTQSTWVDGHFQYLVARNLRAVLAAQWRNDSYSNRSGTMGLEEQFELHWDVRQTDVYFIVRHATLNSSDNNLDNAVFQFGLTRNF